ncbi:MAG: MMPL family transporter [Bacteroidetes bacterium]|nr:MMPL family transporter [Bacteroidota bacterium]
MWDRIATYILKNRLVFVIGILLFTGVAAWFSSKAELAYDMQKLIPKDDPEFVVYQDFKKTFGEDGNKVVIGFETRDLFKLPLFTDFHKLGNEISRQDGVLDVLSPARVYNLQLDTSDMFGITALADSIPATQQELDSIGEIFLNMRFYEGLLYNRKNNVALMVVSLKDSVLNSKGRIPLIQNIQRLCDEFGKRQKLEMHYSGLPFVRTEFATNVRREIVLFTIIAFFVTALLILAFFRSFSTLLVSMLFIVIGVVTMLGVSGILGYKLTLLTGTLPPLLVVIGVQNTIYLINKYHEEYKRHRNKARALSRIISKIGVATFLINFTTAIGFGTFYFTKTTVLEQFGVVAFITINIIFFINIIGIPALYSFLPVPSDKQTAHLDNRTINNFLSWVRYSAFNRKRRIYFWSIVLTAFSCVYIVKLRPLAFMVDDIPHSSKVYQDLVFFQKNFKGVMPLEIIVTCYEGPEDYEAESETDSAATRKKAEAGTRRVKEGGASSAEVLNKANSLQKALRRFDAELSKPISLVEMVSFANQVYNENDPVQYRVPNATNLGDISSRIPEAKPGGKNLLAGLLDKGQTKLRISYQMKDVGSIRMDSLISEIKQIAGGIFPKERYDVSVTGTSAVFLKGNSYLYESLWSSTLWSLLIISLTMALLFPSFKMIIISVIPNIIPLLVTAGLMGYFAIPLKPSTILVFSIAFGITIDATIHFMSTLRRELLHTQKTLREALSDTIMEVGLSMIYTMVALFAGFLIFVFSRFQGTQSLGWLTAVTLFTGLAANLFLLPALILSFEKGLNPKEELKESVLELPDENED